MPGATSPSRPRVRPRTVAALGVAGLAGTLVTALPAAAATQAVTVTATGFTTVAEGATAQVTVTATTSDGLPFAEKARVRVRNGAGSATSGTDFTAIGVQSLTWAKKSASGASRTVSVTTKQDTAAEPSESIVLALDSDTGATLPADPSIVITASDYPYLDPSLPVAARVSDLLGRLTLEEKIGQMTQAERAAVDADQGQITTQALGSLLSGGGSTPAVNTPTAWADMVDSYAARALATRLSIPLIYGVDSVHGHGNLKGATIFPHNIGLGSMIDPALVEKLEHLTAEETRASGPQWAFAPCICVARDMRWGRSYESFGEDPALVELNETGIDGLQGNGGTDLASNDRVLATAKHFAGDGLTTFGTGTGDYTIDQGVDIVDHATFDKLALAPFIPAIKDHNAGSVMPSYSSVDWTEDGVGNPTNMHANGDLINGWLKGEQKFDGFVITDYLGIDHIPGDYPTQVRTGVNAGNDMFMEVARTSTFEATLKAEVLAGRVTTARIDDAVSRILTKKFQLGLFERPFTDRTHLADIGSAAHRALAREAVAKSQVLLKNSNDALPLSKTAKIYVAGRSADNMGLQAGGWTISWQGQPVKDLIPGTTILQGMKQVAPGATVTYSEDASAPTAGSDVGVVVVGETPYSEGFGDVGGPGWPWDPSDGGVPREPNKQLTLTAGDQAVVDKVCAALPTCVVLVVSGRPNVVADPAGNIDGLVAAWQPGTEGGGVSDVLFGDKPYTGQLPQTWAKSQAQEPINVGDADYDPAYPFGWGLRTDSAQARLQMVRDELADLAPKAVVKDLDRALTRGMWAGDGSVAEPRLVLRYVGRAAAGIEEAAVGTLQQRLALVSVLREIAQSRVTDGAAAPAGWAASVADAQHDLLVGDLSGAADLLEDVATARR